MKGTAFRSTLSAIERIHGARGLEAVKEALHDGERSALEHVLPVSWYPISLSAALHSAVRETLGAGSWEVSRRLGREAAKIDYTGVYRVVLRAVQYDTVLSRLELTWRNYYSHGVFEWASRSAGSTRAHVSGVRGFNEGIWLACAGRAESLLEMTGARVAEIAVTQPTERSATFEGMWF